MALSPLSLGSNSDKQKQESSRNIVYNSVLDGSVRQVKVWCDENLEDPESFEAFRWSIVKKTESGFIVRCKYRLRNSVGEYVVSDKTFYCPKTVVSLITETAR